MVTADFNTVGAQFRAGVSCGGVDIGSLIDRHGDQCGIPIERPGIPAGAAAADTAMVKTDMCAAVVRDGTP